MRTWNYDPNLSSADYLALARRRARYHKVTSQELRWILEWEDFDFGVHRSHVDRLLDPDSWSQSVRDAGRKPRVFVECYWNQSGNVEVRSIGGWEHGIYFDNDFTSRFVDLATSGHYGDNRSRGEIMWMHRFVGLTSQALHGRSSVAKAVLFGFKARLDELVQEISEHVDVVGYMPMGFRYVGKNIAGVDFVPNISIDEIRALQAVMFD